MLKRSSSLIAPLTVSCIFSLISRDARADSSAAPLGVQLHTVAAVEVYEGIHARADWNYYSWLPEAHRINLLLGYGRDVGSSVNLSLQGGAITSLTGVWAGLFLLNGGFGTGGFQFNGSVDFRYNGSSILEVRGSATYAFVDSDSVKFRVGVRAQGRENYFSGGPFGVFEVLWGGCGEDSRRGSFRLEAGYNLVGYREVGETRIGHFAQFDASLWSGHVTCGNTSSRE